MKRTISVVLLLACMAGCLLACHPNDDGATTSTTTRPLAPTSSSTVSTVPTTVPAPVPSTPTRPTTAKPTAAPTTSKVPPLTTTAPALQLPYQIPGTELMLDQVAPYDGIYVEDGTNSDIEGVAMIMLRNFGDTDIEYAAITLSYGQFVREFVVTCLPAGFTMVVQEKNRNPMAAGNLLTCTASVVESNRDLQLTYHDLNITENSDNSVTIENISAKDLPSVRLFYKYFMNDMQLLVGGVTFTVNVTELKAGSSVTVKPSHYLKGATMIVMAQTYEESA